MSRLLLSQLGLDHEADERAIKRAYAALLKSRRPDDDAARFQQLHEVYQAALQYVRSRSGAESALAAADTPKRDEVEAIQDAADGGHDHPRSHERGHTAGAEAEEITTAFNPRDFFDTLLQLGLKRPPELQAWLQTHPALYSIQLRNQLVPSLVHALATAEKLPTPGGLDVLLAFFGLDRIDRRNMHLQPRIENLREIAFRQHQVIVGPDMSFMYQANSEPKPRTTSRPSGERMLQVFLLLVCLGTVARCVGNADHSTFAPDHQPVSQDLPSERPRYPSDGTPWRYVPPVSLPPASADPDPD